MRPWVFLTVHYSSSNRHDLIKMGNTHVDEEAPRIPFMSCSHSCIYLSSHHFWRVTLYICVICCTPAAVCTFFHPIYADMFQPLQVFIRAFKMQTMSGSTYHMVAPGYERLSTWLGASDRWKSRRLCVILGMHLVRAQSETERVRVGVWTSTKQLYGATIQVWPANEDQ